MVRTTSKKGMFFALDLCTAFIIILLVCFLSFFVFVRVSQFRLIRSNFFENEHNALFVDSLLKRSVDENGFADVSFDERRVLENRVADFEVAFEKNRENLLRNKVIALKLSSNEIVLDKEKISECRDMAIFRRAFLLKGKFSILEVAFCNDTKH
ncbi:MAG: hypothetical protein QW400_00150 [Candidatus Diapherotrites archaeon]